MRLIHGDAAKLTIRNIGLVVSFSLAVSMTVGHLTTSEVRRARVTDPSRSLQARLPMPEEVRMVMRKACDNCHTYETQWPWYSHMAPASWMIARDVKRARKAVNFSEWSETAGKRKGSAMGTLLAACETAKTRRMPPVQYRLMHSEANLTQPEIDTLCVWTRSAVRQIREAGTSKQARLQRTSPSFE
jgi:hypothetical protein